MNPFIQKYKDFWGKNPKSLLKDYNYQPEATKLLENMKTEEFNRQWLYEMILWKLGRSPLIEDTLIQELKTLKSIKPKHHREGLEIFEKLLACKGFGLAMTSTIFRFLNPSTFQIIDRRAYRSLYSTTLSGQKSETYFAYLDKLWEVCDEDLPFAQADQILYQLDIKQGNKL